MSSAPAAIDDTTTFSRIMRGIITELRNAVVQIITLIILATSSRLLAYRVHLYHNIRYDNDISFGFDYECVICIVAHQLTALT